MNRICDKKETMEEITDNFLLDNPKKKVSHCKNLHRKNLNPFGKKLIIQIIEILKLNWDLFVLIHRHQILVKCLCLFQEL